MLPSKIVLFIHWYTNTLFWLVFCTFPVSLVALWAALSVRKDFHWQRSYTLPQYLVLQNRCLTNLKSCGLCGSFFQSKDENGIFKNQMTRWKLTGHEKRVSAGCVSTGTPTGNSTKITLQQGLNLWPRRSLLPALHLCLLLKRKSKKLRISLISWRCHLYTTFKARTVLRYSPNKGKLGRRY